jgi:DNA-binding PadR family transcriptional regulator
VEEEMDDSGDDICGNDDEKGDWIDKEEEKEGDAKGVDCNKSAVSAKGEEELEETNEEEDKENEEIEDDNDEEEDDKEEADDCDSTEEI